MVWRSISGLLWQNTQNKTKQKEMIVQTEYDDESTPWENLFRSVFLGQSFPLSLLLRAEAGTNSHSGDTMTLSILIWDTHFRFLSFPPLPPCCAAFLLKSSPRNVMHTPVKQRHASSSAVVAGVMRWYSVERHSLSFQTAFIQHLYKLYTLLRLSKSRL